MKGTGVFATPDETEGLKHPVPYMQIGSIPPTSRLERAHRLALAHGLPERPGYYGLNLVTREFLVVDE